MTDDYLRCEDVTFFVELSSKLRKAMIFSKTILTVLYIPNSYRTVKLAYNYSISHNTVYIRNMQS